MSFIESQYARTRFQDITRIDASDLEDRDTWVYRAYDIECQRWAAVKVLADAIPEPQRTEALKRLRREARQMTQLAGPYIVELYATLEDTEQDEVYLCFDYIDGGTLFTELKQNRRLPEHVAALVARDLAYAVDAHWSRRIVHRDIKPANVMLIRDSTGTIVGAKLVDYSVAQSSKEAQLTQSIGQMHLGTPQYMSPEQSSAQRALIAASDLYNIGILLWEMLTGQSHWEQAKVDTSAEALESSTDMAAIVDRALAKDVAVRYSQPTQLADHLNMIVMTAAMSEPPVALVTKAHFLKTRSAKIIVSSSIAGALLIGIGVANAIATQREADPIASHKATPTINGASVEDRVQTSPSGQADPSGLGQTNTPATLDEGSSLSTIWFEWIRGGSTITTTATVTNNATSSPTGVGQPIIGEITATATIGTNPNPLTPSTNPVPSAPTTKPGAVAVGQATMTPTLASTSETPNATRTTVATSTALPDIGDGPGRGVRPGATTRPPTATTSVTPIRNPTPTPTEDPYPYPYPTSNPEPIPVPSATEIVDPTSTPTDPPEPPSEPKPTVAPTETPELTPEPEPTVAPTETPQPTPEPEPTEAPTDPPEPTPEPEPTEAPTDPPEPTPEPEPTEAPTILSG